MLFELQQSELSYLVLSSVCRITRFAVRFRNPEYTGGIQRIGSSAVVEYKNGI